MKKLPYFHLILVIGFVLILIGYQKYSRGESYTKYDKQPSQVGRNLDRSQLAILVAPQAQADAPPPIVDFNGMTYYINLQEADGVSTCYDECEQTWIPFSFAMEDEVLAVPETYYHIDLHQRNDGLYQATYKGYPLYQYTGDAQQGDQQGLGVGEKWVVATLD